MANTSQMRTVQHDASPQTERDVHARPTRILRTPRDPMDARKTVESIIATPGAACWSCRAHIEIDAQFCGMCGQRARARRSLLGEVLDRLYHCEDKLAEGSTATVYRACYLPSGKYVALKVLHPELAYDRGAVARFRREAKCLGRLRSPHTVAVYDHGETSDGTHYIALELLAAERLDVRVRTRGPMRWREALSIVRSVCLSLAEAHSHGIVHRDLTTANVLLGDGDLVKVIDFGLAKLRPEDGDDELTSAGQAIGSLSHAAPEQLTGRTCDRRADVYAVGVIASELLLGRPPVLDGALRFPDLVPKQVASMIARCLAADPAARFGSAIAIANEIDRLLAPNEPPQARGSARVDRRRLAHTSAFELMPPRIVIDTVPDPTFARGSDPEIEVEVEPPARGRWKLWAAALVMCGIGLGTAVAGCV